MNEKNKKYPAIALGDIDYVFFEQEPAKWPYILYTAYKTYDVGRASWNYYVYAYEFNNVTNTNKMVELCSVPEAKDIALDSRQTIKVTDGQIHEDLGCIYAVKNAVTGILKNYIYNRKFYNQLKKILPKTDFPNELEMLEKYSIDKARVEWDSKLIILK